MEVQIHEQSGISIIKLIGRMTESSDCLALQRSLQHMTEANRRMFVINMAEVEPVGLAGIGALHNLLDEVARVGGKFRISEPNETTRNMLSGFGSQNSYRIASSDAEAVASFNAAPEKPAAAILPDWPYKAVIQCPSSEDNIAEATRMFTSFLDQCKIDTGIRFNLEIAFTEALSNAISHGNKADPSKCVTAECMANRQMLKVRMTDEGDGFDVNTTIDLKSNPFHDGGHGLTLIQSLMDEVRFNERGNSVSMTKFCSHSSSNQHDRKDY